MLKSQAVDHYSLQGSFDLIRRKADAAYEGRTAGAASHLSTARRLRLWARGGRDDSRRTAVAFDIHRTSAASFLARALEPPARDVSCRLSRW